MDLLPVGNCYCLEMVRSLTLEELWELGTTKVRLGNSLCYHTCCDVWTTKHSSKKRSSHSVSITWGKLLASLPKDIESKKRGLEAKMKEEKWRLPALLNQTCQNRQRYFSAARFPFKPHVPPTTRLPDLAYTRGEDMEEPTGTISLTRISNTLLTNPGFGTPSPLNNSILHR